MTWLLLQEFATACLPCRIQETLCSFRVRTRENDNGINCFWGKTIVNFVNSISVIRNSRLMRARRCGKGFRPRGERSEEKLGERIVKMEMRERNLQLKLCC
jgi:hypothetical protein